MYYGQALTGENRFDEGMTMKIGINETVKFKV